MAGGFRRPSACSRSSATGIVLGEAGIGKTRLLAELAREALGRGIDVLLGRAFESEQLLAFGPWVAAIRDGRVLDETDVLDALAPAWRGAVGLMIPYLIKGEVTEAIAVGEQAVALCEKVDAPILLPMIRSQLGHAYMLANRGAEALPLSEAGEQGFVVNGVMAGYSIMLRYLAETYRTVGRIDDATRAARRAHEVARRYGEVDHEAEALRVLGDIAVAGGPTLVADAEGHYRRALAIAIPRGARPLAAHCHLGLGTLFLHTGEWTRADEHLATAIGCIAT